MNVVSGLNIHFWIIALNFGWAIRGEGTEAEGDREVGAEERINLASRNAGDASA